MTAKRLEGMNPQQAKAFRDALDQYPASYKATVGLKEIERRQSGGAAAGGQ